MKFIIIVLLFINLFADSEHHINKDLSHLNLTKEQKDSIRGILKEFRNELKEFREFKEDINKRRREIFLNENLDMEELIKLNYDLSQRADSLENRVLKKLHSILTLSQREKFLYYFDDWKVE